jgi:hypothetical protein
VAPSSSLATSTPVEILLSTYNGERYLDAFLTSLAAQDVGNWTLTIRDDGSSDGTLEIIRSWVRKLPARIHLLQGENPGNIGVVRSFSRLLETSTAPYVMFADQDDIWLPGKVRLTLTAMRERERKTDPTQPILVHTDATIVDAQLHPSGATVWRRQGISPAGRSKFSRILVENVALGCTMMLNRPLVEVVRFLPSDMGYHDWWIALVASAFGELVALYEPQILWRRHGANESEVSNIGAALQSTALDPFALRRRLTRVFQESRPRVTTFLAMYRDRLQPAQIAAADAFLRLDRQDFLARRLAILRHRLLFVAPLRNVGLFTLI